MRLPGGITLELSVRVSLDRLPKKVACADCLRVIRPGFYDCIVDQGELVCPGCHQARVDERDSVPF